ncbi:MAG: addiction module protein [candidate division WOR-3 bacterium]
MSIEELKMEALRLSPEARAYLARELLASLDGLSEAEIEKLWIDEAIRRDEELDSGTARAYPADEVLARARTRRK